MSKKITLFGLLSLFSFLNYAQNSINQIDELLNRHQNIPTNGNSLAHYFTLSEIEILRNHLSTSDIETARTQNRDPNAAIIFGNHSDSNSFVSFSTYVPTSLNIIGSNSGSSDFESAGDIDPTDTNRAYALTINNGEFYEIDITTGIYTSLGTINPPGDEVWNGIEFDPQTNILYAISSNFVDSSTVSTIDIPTLETTIIGVTGMPGAIAIATDGAGSFYTYDVIDDSFYSIDITTGAATLIGPIGFDANFGQDLEWDSESQTMYMTALNNINLDGELRTVDLSTGEATFISIINTSDNGQFPWASISTESTLSIDDTFSSDLTIFPNPAQNIIKIQSNILISNIAIYNLLGQKVIDKNINATENELPINTLKNGMYLMQVSINGITETYRFIKN